MVCSIATAQTSERGVTNSGLYIGDVVEAGKQASLGLVAHWRADSGVVLGGVGLTNVFSWNSMVGNYPANQYNPTNAPAYIVAGTNFLGNAIKCLNFTTQAGQGVKRLDSDNLASLFSGSNKPFTCIVVCNGTSGGTFTVTAMGWSASTNASASRMGLRNNSGSPSTDMIFYHCSDTNNVATQVSVSGTVTTGVWCVKGATFDGTILTAFSNLSPSSSVDLTGQGPMTVDRYCIGALRNQTTITQQTNTKVAEIRWYTNGLTGAQWTNEVNEINQYWGGLYP